MKQRVFDLFFYIYSVERFTLKEAVVLIGNGAKYRAVEYYKGIYINDVEKIGGVYYVTQAFIDKVKKNREALGKNTTDTRTKADLLKEIENFQEEIEAYEKEIEDYRIYVGAQQVELVELKSINNNIGIEEIQKEIKELKEVIADYENSEVYEKANEGLRVEVFSQEEYDVFSERLIQWRLQRQEIEQTKVHFESVKDELVFVKGQLDYFKSSNDKILTQHQNLIDGLRERNRIEAVEKGAIPKEPREI